MIKFEFVNHSSFIISKDNFSLASDPWIEGSVFNNSWDLLVETPAKSIKNLTNSNYVWFSHEHPDHFNPRNLNIFSNNNTFLFQKTKDRRVVSYLSKISKNIIELSSENTIKICDNFTFRIIPFQYLDSFSITKINNITILNLNDCDIKKISQLEYIKNICGKIDILLVQFSYAIGKSNVDEIKQRKDWAKAILLKLSKNIKFLNPKVVIPFASFCFFSNYNNFYLNDSINKIDYTIKFLQENNPNIKFKCFYPGDVWDLKSDFDINVALNKYNLQYKKIKPKVQNVKKFNYSDLNVVSKKFIKITKENNNLFSIYNLLNKKFHNIYFLLTDLNKIYFFDFENGLVEKDFIKKDFPLCKLDSETLFQLFSSGYGYDSLIIGGRFEANKKGLKCLDKIFKFQAKNYQNIFYNYQSLLKKLLNKIFSTNKIYYER